MSDPILIISSDCHAGLPPERYRDYVDPEYREIFDVALPIQIEEVKKASKKFLVEDFNVEWRKGHEQQLTGAWDSDMRNQVLDADGVAGEVIFPDGITEMNLPPFGAGLSLPTEGIDPKLQWAGARAHNRWIAEFCQMAPERRAGLAIVPILWSVEEAVKEIEWARENGLRGILIPSMWGSQDPYHHPKYEPVWSACEDTGMVMHLHSGAAPMSDYDDHQGMMGLYISEVVWWSARPIWFLIWGGVFERHPKLRLAITESTCVWVPEALTLHDFRYSEAHYQAKLGDYQSHLSKKPSEYFHEHVFLGASCMPRTEVVDRERIGIGNIMWGTDYPHPEGSWPETSKQLHESFDGIPEADLRAMLGGNAAALYGFDTEKLAPLAARIGPNPAAFASTTKES
ncbi:MAG: amidohydrolase family protein [Myxococcota bacterium]|nr:amidohydrolase family protein [Myxococcota bacterium]